jgi:5-hydroxyisourate hydrolase
MSAITTHVLDLSRGRPARGVSVTLSAGEDAGHWNVLAEGVTDANGRVRDLLPAGATLSAGRYRLRFDTQAYFHTLGQVSFYTEVVVGFVIDDPSAHYHVPLLLSPFGYSTYRGT